MLDSDEYSRILDILGNRNRRRIISLLRQKPCFVTELSERLTLSPKALIEHLALMEQMEILGSYLDERRRKYYYLTRDLSVEVSFGGKEKLRRAPPLRVARWQNTLSMVRRRAAWASGVRASASSRPRCRARSLARCIVPRECSNRVWFAPG
jgi:ArsR family transcriptional regulator